MPKMCKMQVITNPQLIDREAWQRLVDNSSTASWFQTSAAYDFYASLPELMTPFVVAVQEGSELKGVAVGYVTREKNPLKQFFTRRAIIIGGPMLSREAEAEEVKTLMTTVKKTLRSLAIFVETRNFNDYFAYRSAFEQSGFEYVPHYDFHVDTSSEEVIDANLGKNRKRDIRTSFRDGVTIVEKPSLEQVKAWYELLKDLYVTKVKTPLFPWRFFEQLYRVEDARYLLTEYEGRVIGGTLCMVLPNTALYEWFVCGEDGVYKNIFPSSVATYAGLCHSSKIGCPRFDMMGAGVPGVAYGVRDFKARFGGELKELGRFQSTEKPLLYQIGKLGVKLLKHR